MTNIYIFNNASRAAGYGIGTYIKQLAEGLSVMPETKVSLVEMYADTKEFAISDDKDGIRHYLIPSLHSGTENETYCRVIFYFLARNIDNVGNDKIVFHFNYFQHYPLAVLLKSFFVNSCIVMTVHYMSWCFELNGNVKRMKAITAEGYEPTDDKERALYQAMPVRRCFCIWQMLCLCCQNAQRTFLPAIIACQQTRCILFTTALPMICAAGLFCMVIGAIFCT